MTVMADQNKIVQVFLTNERFIKDLVQLDENYSSKYLHGALLEAQEIDLRNILGSNLLETLKGMVQEGNIPDMYKELIDKCQYFLAYKTMEHSCMASTFKLSNIGTVMTSDDNVHNLSWSDLTHVREYFSHKADYFTKLLQQFLLQNKASFPELDECACNTIKSNLKSSAACGLWLGGVRAYRLRKI